MLSKRIKDSYMKPDPKPKTYAGELYQTGKKFLLSIFVYPIQDKYSMYRERIRRSYAFARRGWLNYDFESAYLYDLMAFKLRRIHAALLAGHAVQEKEDMKALREAIKICERLFDGRYADKYYKEIDKKFGKIKTKDIPNEDGTTSWEITRTKVKTKLQHQKEREAIKKLYVDAENDRKADIDRLAEILKNHEPAWWD